MKSEMRAVCDFEESQHDKPHIQNKQIKSTFINRQISQDKAIGEVFN